MTGYRRPLTSFLNAGPILLVNSCVDEGEMEIEDYHTLRLAVPRIEDHTLDGIVVDDCTFDSVLFAVRSCTVLRCLVTVGI